MKINLIIAMTSNDVIGLDNMLPWCHQPDDLKSFRDITMGHTVIMGRKTYDSIVGYTKAGEEPLPGRSKIVMSRSAEELPFVDFVFNAHISPFDDNYLIDIFTLGPEPVHIPDEVFIIGGLEIYKHFLPIIDRFYVTRVKTTISGSDVVWRDGDHYDFIDVVKSPFKIVNDEINIKDRKYQLTDKKELQANDKNQFDMEFLVFELTQ